jgi:hypothetical protein
MRASHLFYSFFLWTMATSAALKGSKKNQCLKLVSTFIADKREDLGCKPMIYNTMLDTCT